MFAKSYNATHDKKIEYIVGDYGYRIKLNTAQDYSSSISLSEDDLMYKGLYFDSEKTQGGYSIVSPSNVDGCIIYIGHVQNMTDNANLSWGCNFRPVVCIEKSKLIIDNSQQNIDNVLSIRK